MVTPNFPKNPNCFQNSKSARKSVVLGRFSRRQMASPDELEIETYYKKTSKSEPGLD